MKHYLRSVSVGVHRLHIQRDGLHFAPIGDRGELQHCVEGTLQVGHLIWMNESKGKNTDMNTVPSHLSAVAYHLDYDTKSEGLWVL